MHHDLKSNLLTVSAALVPSLLRLPSSAVNGVRTRANTTAEGASHPAHTRWGLRHGLNLFRYILWGKGEYAPPIGKFTV